MSRKIKIQKVSIWSMGITVAIAVLYSFIVVQSEKEFHILETTTQQYIECEQAARQLRDGSEYLTEQVRMYAMTGNTEYMDNYFEEVNVTRRREEALEEIRKYYDGTDTIDALEKALDYSNRLMETEIYSMRLISEVHGLDQSEWPEELLAVEESAEDQRLNRGARLTKGRNMVSDTQYDTMRTEINSDIKACTDSVLSVTHKKQNRASDIFSDMLVKLRIGIVILVAMLLGLGLMLRHLIVKPLLCYMDSIKKGVIFPVVGAAELQYLAETYNEVCLENQETQKLIRHQAEHDSMTELLNRGSFERVLDVYEKGDSPYALILIDVDTFKTVNDTYGHATGDIILKRVASLLKNAFRSIDFVCRIGGDEFAIVMVEMTSDLKYTIEEKIKWVNEELSRPTEDAPAVSLSVGVAFSDRENPGEDIFKDADKALYNIKENGRNGCGFY